MSYLGVILQRHENKDYFNTKILQEAARFDSFKAARNLITEGWDSYEKLRDLIRRLPSPVAHDILNDLTAETPFEVRVAGEDEGDPTPPLVKCVDVMGDWAEFTKEMIAALRDRRITPDEYDRLTPKLNDVERTIASVREDVESRRTMRPAG